MISRLQINLLNVLGAKAVRNILIGLYILIILGISASAKADITIYPGVDRVQKSQIHQFAGDVVVTLDGTAYLIVSEKEFYELASSEIDFDQFNGSKVTVEGFEFKHKSGPVFTPFAMDPLDGELSVKRVAPVLVVFGISEVAE